MAVRCAKCGEELMGAVNRCWRCGTHFVAPPNALDLPPVRQIPAVTAAPVESPPPSSSVLEASLHEVAATATVAERPLRVGSPFAAPAPTDPVASAPANTRPPINVPRQPIYPQNLAATGGAAACLVLGVISLLAMRTLPIAAIITAATGILFGAWGLYSRHRAAAILGLLLCCFALAVASFLAVVELYEYLHNGLSPLESLDT